jgi:DNA-binding PadR family transcriptional regulator
MASERDHMEVLQGTLDLVVLRAVQTMEPQHAYGLAARLDRDARYYAITPSGARSLTRQAVRWWRLLGLVTKLLLSRP